MARKLLLRCGMGNKTILLLFAVVAGCGTVSKPIDVDASAITVDVATDAARTDMAAPARRQGGLVSTSGGGIAASSQHTLRARFAAPQPVGRATSTDHNLITGPGSLP